MADTNDPQPAYRIKSVAPPTISNLEGNIIREIAESTISVGKQDRYVRSGVKGRSELATIHRPILWFLPSSKDPGGWLDLLAGFRYTYLGEQVGLQANNMAIDGASTQLVNQFAQQVATPGSDLRTLIQQNIVRNRANRRSTCLAIDPERIRAALGASSVGPQHEIESILTSIDRKPTVKEATMTLPNKTEHWALVDTHRHPVGPRLRAKMAERGLYDPKQEFPQANAQDLISYREFFDLDYPMPKQREGGVTLSLASNEAATAATSCVKINHHDRRLWRMRCKIHVYCKSCIPASMDGPY